MLSPRRFLQFRLRHFFIFILVLSLPLGWAGSHLGATQRENALVAKLRAKVGPTAELRRPINPYS